MRFPAYIRHHSPGRIRVRIKNASPAHLSELRDRLSTIPEVQNVETNSITGSLLIFYSPVNGKDFLQSFSEHAGDLIAFAPKSCSDVGDYSTTATDLLKRIKQSDDGLRVLSGGRADLKLLFPLAMVGLTIATLPTNLQTPLWLSFLMFGFSSFESMHTGALEQPGGKSGEEEESNASGGASQG